MCNPTRLGKEGSDAAQERSMTMRLGERMSTLPSNLVLADGIT
jgi:hypothetical protein